MMQETFFLEEIFREIVKRRDKRQKRFGKSVANTLQRKMHQEKTFFSRKNNGKRKTLEEENIYQIKCFNTKCFEKLSWEKPQERHQNV